MLDFHDWYHCFHYSGAFHCNHNHFHYPHIFNYSSLLSLHLLITITVACPILGDLWKSYSGSADLADHPILSYIKVSEWSQCHHLRHHHYHHPPLPFTNKNWKVLFNLILSFQHNLKVRLAWVCKRDESGVIFERESENIWAWMWKYGVSEWVSMYLHFVTKGWMAGGVHYKERGGM